MHSERGELYDTVHPFCVPCMLIIYRV